MTQPNFFFVFFVSSLAWSACGPLSLNPNDETEVNQNLLDRLESEAEPITDLEKELNAAYTSDSENLPLSFALESGAKVGASGTFKIKKSVSSTFVITKSGAYDFKNVLYVWKGTNWNCTADLENGPQILRIEADNVTVKNFAFVGDGSTYGSKGLGDPIHIATCADAQGQSCSRQGPKNVTLDGIYGHACEDMITIGTPGAKNITIKNSTLRANPKKSSWDKTLQINFGTDLKFLNNHFVGGKRCLRLGPKTSSYVKNNKFDGCSQPILVDPTSSGIQNMVSGSSTIELYDNDYVTDTSIWEGLMFWKEQATFRCKNTNVKGEGKFTCK